MQGYGHLEGNGSRFATIRNFAADARHNVSRAAQAVVGAITPARLEMGFVLAGCGAFVVSGILGIRESSTEKEKVDHSLIIVGSVGYAAALCVASSKRVQESGKLYLNLATLPELAGAAGSYLAFGIRQYNEGGPLDILIATIIFTAAISAKVAYNTLRIDHETSPLLQVALLVHYISAIAGAVIFLDESAKGTAAQPSVTNPALSSAIGAGCFILGKGIGGGEKLATAINTWLNNTVPAEEQAINPEEEV
jgi:hypothetical protein